MRKFIPPNISAIKRYLGFAKFLSSENFYPYGITVSSTELTVGFEMEQYTFTEPDSGVSVRIGTVCIVLADGSSQLGVPLTVQPLWRDGSAIGNIPGFGLVLFM